MAEILEAQGDLGARHVQEVLAQLVHAPLVQPAVAMIPNFLAERRSSEGQDVAARSLVCWEVFCDFFLAIVVLKGFSGSTQRFGRKNHQGNSTYEDGCV